MKKSVFILMAAMLLNVVQVFATDPQKGETKSAKAVTTQIFKMLSEKTIPDEIRGSSAEVRIALDNGDYLRILSVKTENEELATYIRSCIDFQKVSKGTFEQGVIYRIPLEVSKKGSIL
ncbi:hypothetical protein H4O18_11860 [Arenibacter sp. BSSL-BM3]|uniref:Uncharacterized protein n=1 Tax=Arenibacter arenosicollis TaxID=2762274 RepID=A0ABR7QP57_9FLAO|nr:hypothetical protein [Arenibacter arenosicollis]MBC8768690.1 hypothetical protein [Arenibacter arenosicollis]